MPKKVKNDKLQPAATLLIDRTTERAVIRFLINEITNEQLVEAAVVLLQVANKVIDNKSMIIKTVSDAMGEAVLFDKNKMH